MSLKLFDSHAHYYDKRFESETEGGVENLISSLFADNVGYIVNVATNNENAEECIAQAKKYENMYTAIGIHPSDCRAYTDVESEILRLREFIGTAEKRAENKVVALGEIGFDYHYEDTDKIKQTAFFDAQMRLARELSLPVVIHDRDAHGDTMDMVRKHPDVTGVFHSFSGSVEMARELVRRGWYISFSGVVTFKNAARVKEVATSVPLDRILIETDCPYLAPHPHRGETNHSGFMVFTAETVAELHGITTEECAALTRENAMRLFRIK